MQVYERLSEAAVGDHLNHNATGVARQAATKVHHALEYGAQAASGGLLEPDPPVPSRDSPIPGAYCSPAQRRRQLRKNGKNARRIDRPTLWYQLIAPDGTEVWPIAPEGWEGRWVLKEEEWERRAALGLTDWKRREYGWVPYYIETAPEEGIAPYSTIWSDVGQTRQAKAALTKNPWSRHSIRNP